jgi:flavin reductase (DIM6/NTAB) family NADH-FMN oxidoreductase RutF
MVDSTIDVRELRRALGAFVTGVTVVTTIDEEGNPRGFTANSFSSVSLDPPLVLVCIAKTAASCPIFSAAKGYAVNILAEGQRDVSGTFASRSAEKFGTVSWRIEETGSPILDGVTAWFDCELHNTVDAGDHVILLGHVLAFDHAPANPLGYCRGNYVNFGLAREALEAASGQKTRVGAILEQNGSLLLLTDRKTGAVSLPVAAHLGEQGDAKSLAGTVASLGVEAEIGFLFAVFEDVRSATHSIYYRGEVYGGEPDSSQARFYAFDDIPWDKLPDDAVRSMLRRYVTERREDAFGVYVGGIESGVVQALGKKA